MSADSRHLGSLSIDDIGCRIRVHVDGSIVEGTLQNFTTDIVMSETRNGSCIGAFGAPSRSTVTIELPFGSVACNINSQFELPEE